MDTKHAKAILEALADFNKDGGANAHVSFAALLFDDDRTLGEHIEAALAGLPLEDGQEGIAALYEVGGEALEPIQELRCADWCREGASVGLFCSRTKGHVGPHIGHQLYGGSAELGRW